MCYCVSTGNINMIKSPFDKLSGCIKLNTVKLKLSGFYVFSTVLCMYEFICMAYNKVCILKHCYTFNIL